MQRYSVSESKLTRSPAGAQSLPTCSLNPAGVAIASGGNGAAVLTVNTTAASTTALLSPFAEQTLRLGGEGAALAMMLMLGVPARRRRWMQMLVLLWLIAVAGAIGCGGGGSTSGGGSIGPTQPTTLATTPGNYTFTVTGTDSANAQIIVSANVDVTIQ